MFYKIGQNGLFVEKEKKMPLIFENVKLECGYRIDLLVGNKLVVEIKSVEVLHDVHLAQTLTYMKLGDYRIRLIDKFQCGKIKTRLKKSN
ncbi:MAG TPA: GxxExxY protein [Flavobacteriaceae bacterium]|nr:GxxExxY protein [Flavobacteriaceae bacterium]